MRRYSTGGEFFTGGDTLFLALTNSTSIRGRIYYVALGYPDKPVDGLAGFAIRSGSDLGGASVSNSNPLDPSDPPANLEVYVQGPGDQTEDTGDFLRFAFNLRQMFEWTATKGSEIIVPAFSPFVGLIGLGISAGTTNEMACTMMWQE